MFKRYFLEELSRLKELGAEFGEAYPAIAPLLGGPSADPDVERLLEGVAFQTAMLRQKLDDDFPEIIHDLMHLVMPHYLRPIPAATMAAFAPAPSLRQSVTVPRGTRLLSVPVDGTRCGFTTTCDVEVHPLELEDACLINPPGRSARIILSMSLNGIPLSQWRPGKLRVHLAGDHVSASDLYLLLSRRTRQIVLSPADDGRPVTLPASCLQPAGFSDRESMITYPTHAFPGFRLLQEYFTFPGKFMCLDISGWERWLDRGDGRRFSIEIELDDVPPEASRVTRDNFALFAVPAVNIFSHDADPVSMDNQRDRYLVRPSGEDPSHFQVFSVDCVTGFMRGTARRRAYEPFELLGSGDRDAPTYHTSLQRSPVSAGYDVYLTLSYPQGCIPPAGETLTIGLTCTNGALPERLRIGDVCMQTADTPANVSFRNITNVTPAILPPLEPGLPWRLTSHLALNYLSLADATSLRSLLELYLFPDNRQSAAVAANRKRIAGIEGVRERPCDRLVNGVMMRGREVSIRLRGDHFAGPGDMYLFGCVLDRFLGICASINTFTRLSISETLKGEIVQWPPRLGNQLLL